MTALAAVVKTACLDAYDNRVKVPLHVLLSNSTLRRVVKRLHFPLKIVLVCVRWYAACPLSLRKLKEVMTERGDILDHATVYRWALQMMQALAAVFRRNKLPVCSSWRVNGTYALGTGQWMTWYRDVDRS